MDETVLKKVENFFSPYKEVEYKKGKLLIRAFENPNNIFFLTEGFVKMYSISKNGKEFVLNVFKPTSFFPMSLAVNNEDNFYHFEAITPIKVRKAPVRKVVSFLKNNPDVMFDLLKRLYKGIDGLLMKVDYAVTSDAKSRIIVELITQAKRFGIKNNKNVELNLTINSLSTYVGLARETVSRQIKILKDKKLISLKGNKIIIFDLNKLINEVF